MIKLLEQCLRIPSLSGQEAAVASFLVSEMARRGFSGAACRAFVDEAGNAVGVLGNGPRQMVLLGHMDTVGGDVPVRYENGALYGRGAVDAKGPLCAFVLAAQRIAESGGVPDGWQLIVVGATEEEAASSRGARYAATQYRAELCVIGEPSGSDGITLGYKGRLLINAHLEQSSQHTALPGANASEAAVALWNYVVAHAAAFNADRPKAFDQILPSLRRIQSGDDGLKEWCDILIGARLPLDFGPEAVQALVSDWDAQRQVRREGDLRSPISAQISYQGPEQAYRSSKDSVLARAFVGAIRAEKMRPAFKLKTGTADFNILGPAWQCPIVAYGPGDSSLDHTPNEHVPIMEFERGVRVLEGALRSILTIAK
jgi:[amino group carrier protein]-lysine/ornithine hydrolase